MKASRVFCLLGLSLCLQSCAILSRAPLDPVASRRSSLAEEAGPLEYASYPQDGAAISDYFQRSDSLDPTHGFTGRRRMGTVEAGGYKIGVILLEPPEPPSRGTVLAYHGYLSYSAYNLSALYRVAQAGWTVMAADLPGHGFSSGDPGEIGDFSVYAAVSRDLLSWAARQDAYDMPRPFVLLGHSAGGAAALETLWSEPASADAAILVAPLVRPMRMALAGLGALVLAPFVHTVPPFGAEEDYLGVAHLPLSWVRALSRWESRFSERPSIEVPILIIQGEDDDFLDWRHGLEVIARSAPRAETHILAGVGHIPFDTKEAQERALTLIIPFLSTLEAPDSM